MSDLRPQPDAESLRKSMGDALRVLPRDYLGDVSTASAMHAVWPIVESLILERDSVRSDLTQLRDRIGALADEIASTATVQLEPYGITKDSYGLGRGQAFSSAATRLRALLPAPSTPAESGENQ